MNATQLWATASPDGRFRVVFYRFPRLNDIPETLGLGQGFVRLEEVATGRVLGEKHAEDLSPIRGFKWESSRVVVYDSLLSEWSRWTLPR
jgi:hypothetical protein